MKIISINYQNLKSQQLGVSLVELLVSMVIGLFLLGGVVTNLIGTKDSDRVRAAISEMDDSARTALSIMRQSIQHAGYPSIHNKIIEKSFYTESDGSLNNPLCSDNQPRDLTYLSSDDDRQTKDRDRGDVITIISLADNPCRDGLDSCPDIANVNPEAQVYVDCMGGGTTRDNHVVACSAEKEVDDIIPVSGRIYSTFRLGGGNNSRTLYCDGNRGGTQPLVDNIEAMQILYGVRLDSGNIRYRNADTVDTEGQWGMVSSVQVALLVRSSRNNVLKQDATKTQYTLLDSVRVVSSSDLRRLFRVYTTTINLANQNKGGIL